MFSFSFYNEIVQWEKERLKESLFLHEQRYLILFTPFRFEKPVKSKLFFTYSFFYLSLLAYLADL
jgi:hypothetical protein